MYRESSAEIKRTVTITEPETLEIEIIIRARGSLRPDQIKNITEIADNTERSVIRAAER